MPCYMNLDLELTVHIFMAVLIPLEVLHGHMFLNITKAVCALPVLVAMPCLDLEPVCPSVYLPVTPPQLSLHLN